MRNILATKRGIIGVGLAIGVLASLLQFWGNPANMGICVACFVRDITGALGLHRAPVVQYMRPEIIGFVLGSFGAAYLFKEFRPRLGSAPIVRFILGAFAMIGALVFLGCPWRALLRLAGGDGNAILGLLGLIAGIWIGTRFLKAGYNLGPTHKTYSSVGWIFPLIMVGFLALMLVCSYPRRNRAVFFSTAGGAGFDVCTLRCIPHRVWVSDFAQKSRFCTIGAIATSSCSSRLTFCWIYQPGGGCLCHKSRAPSV